MGEPKIMWETVSKGIAWTLGSSGDKITGNYKCYVQTPYNSGVEIPVEGLPSSWTSATLQAYISIAGGVFQYAKLPKDALLLLTVVYWPHYVGDKKYTFTYTIDFRKMMYEKRHTIDLDDYDDPYDGYTGPSLTSYADSKFPALINVDIATATATWWARSNRYGTLEMSYNGILKKYSVNYKNITKITTNLSKDKPTSFKFTSYPEEYQSYIEKTEDSYSVSCNPIVFNTETISTSYSNHGDIIVVNGSFQCNYPGEYTVFDTYYVDGRYQGSPQNMSGQVYLSNSTGDKIDYSLTCDLTQFSSRPTKVKVDVVFKTFPWDIYQGEASHYVTKDIITKDAPNIEMDRVVPFVFEPTLDNLFESRSAVKVKLPQEDGVKYTLVNVRTSHTDPTGVTIDYNSTESGYLSNNLLRLRVWPLDIFKPLQLEDDDIIYLIVSQDIPSGINKFRITATIRKVFPGDVSTEYDSSVEFEIMSPTDVKTYKEEINKGAVAVMSHDTSTDDPDDLKYYPALMYVLKNGEWKAVTTAYVNL